jgi:hypothetical protein
VAASTEEDTEGASAEWVAEGKAGEEKEGG